jgi:DNA (cytosine-5)-methyltransferase 1
LDPKDVKKLLENEPIHLLAGCPPCQGFSSIRRRNKPQAAADERNTLISEYFRFVKKLHPLTFVFENVPGIAEYALFQDVCRKLQKRGYEIAHKVVDVARFGVPQRRKRLVMIGSRVGHIDIPQGEDRVTTVRNTIAGLEPPAISADPIHRMVATHIPRILEMIRKIPPDGGSRKDLPAQYILACHKKDGVGFHDVYGRLRWDSVSSTITGGCLNPSKGRFLHPEEHRSISAREAAMLQTFPRDYIFPEAITKTELALMIGNALPPRFAQTQAEHIATFFREHGIV